MASKDFKRDSWEPVFNYVVNNDILLSCKKNQYKQMQVDWNSTKKETEFIKNYSNVSYLFEAVTQTNWALRDA